MKNLHKICPVCGFDKLDDFPYNEDGNPSYEICTCCGFEFGFDDSSEGYSFEEYRKEWTKKGFDFFDLDSKPSNWDEKIMLKQLDNIRLVDYKPRL